MSLDTEYKVPYHRNEPESLQNVFIILVHRQIKSRYPHKFLSDFSDKHAKLFRL